MKLYVPVCVFVLLTAVAAAGERSISEREVPRAVIDAVTKKYPTANRVGFTREAEHGRTTYEVKLADHGRRIDVDVDPAGGIHSEEETVRVDDVPPAVRRSIAASPLAKGRVVHAEKVITDGKADTPSWELVIALGRQKVEVLLASDGKILRKAAE